MKKALILSAFAALALSFAASAQAPMYTTMQGARPRTRQEFSPEGMAEKEADMLKETLKLSKGQYNKIFNFLYEQAADMMESGMVRGGFGGPGFGGPGMGGPGFGGGHRDPGSAMQGGHGNGERKELTQEQKEQMQQKMQEMQEKREEMQAAKVKKFSKILKPAQFEKWQQMEKERADKMEEMREQFRQHGQHNQQPDAE